MTNSLTGRCLPVRLFTLGSSGRKLKCLTLVVSLLLSTGIQQAFAGAVIIKPTPQAAPAGVGSSGSGHYVDGLAGSSGLATGGGGELSLGGDAPGASGSAGDGSGGAGCLCQGWGVDVPPGADSDTQNSPSSPGNHPGAGSPNPNRVSLIDIPPRRGSAPSAGNPSGIAEAGAGITHGGGGTGTKGRSALLGFGGNDLREATSGGGTGTGTDDVLSGFDENSPSAVPPVLTAALPSLIANIKPAGVETADSTGGESDAGPGMNKSDESMDESAERRNQATGYLAKVPFLNDEEGNGVQLGLDIGGSVTDRLAMSPVGEGGSGASGVLPPVEQPLLLASNDLSPSGGSNNLILPLADLQPSDVPEPASLLLLSLGLVSLIGYGWLRNTG